MTEKNHDAGAGKPDLPTAASIDALAALGRAASDPAIVSIDTKGLGDGLPATVPALFDRGDQNLDSVRRLIEEFRLRPERRTGTAKVQTLASFYALLNRHKDADSAVFADMNWRAPKLLAVVDYHKREEEAHEPRWLGHRIAYEFPLSDQWQAWVGQTGQMMKQGDFAAFIEDHIADLAAPTNQETEEWERLFATSIADPHEIAMLSRGLSVSVGAKVGRAVNLQSGEGEIVFEEVHRDNAGQKLKVPGLFVISLPVFFRGERVRLPVRLRYRVNGSELLWAFQLWRPDEFVTDAIERDCDAVRVETGLPLYEGMPEA